GRGLGREAFGGVPSEALTSPALLSQRERREKRKVKRELFLVSPLSPWERGARGSEGFGGHTADRSPGSEKRGPRRRLRRNGLRPPAGRARAGLGARHGGPARGPAAARRSRGAAALADVAPLLRDHLAGVAAPRRRRAPA